jgi:hypothetical protein
MAREIPDSIGPVLRGDVVRQPRTLVEEALSRQSGARRADAIGIFIALHAAIISAGQLFPACWPSGFGLHQILHALAPRLVLGLGFHRRRFHA